MDKELINKLKEGGFPFRPQADSLLWNKQPVDLTEIPTLSELIDECGDKFLLLAKDYKEPYWRASSIEKVSALEFGATPVEAVARLWLALQEKR